MSQLLWTGQTLGNRHLGQSPAAIESEVEFLGFSGACYDLL